MVLQDQQAFHKALIRRIDRLHKLLLYAALAVSIGFIALIATFIVFIIRFNELLGPL